MTLIVKIQKFKNKMIKFHIKSVFRVLELRNDDNINHFESFWPTNSSVSPY